MVRCRPSLLAAIADQPSPPCRGRQHAVIGAPPSNCADGGPFLVTVHSLDWQKLPGYWWLLGSFLQRTTSGRSARARHQHGKHRKHRHTFKTYGPRGHHRTHRRPGPGRRPRPRRRPRRPGTARPHRPDDPAGEGRPALRHAGLRPLRHRPRPGRHRRQPQGDRRPHGGRADRQVPGGRHHLLHLGAQHPGSTSDRRPLQRHPARLPDPAPRPARPRLHRPGTRRRLPRRRARHPLPGCHGHRCGRLAHRRPRPRPYRRPGTEGARHPAELLPRGRRERQPGQPGHRRPLLRRRPGRGGRHGRRRGGRIPGLTPRPAGSGHRQALPRARRHRRRQPLRLPGHHPHP